MPERAASTPENGQGEQQQTEPPGFRRRSWLALGVPLGKAVRRHGGSPADVRGPGEAEAGVGLRGGEGVEVGQQGSLPPQQVQAGHRALLLVRDDGRRQGGGYAGRRSILEWSWPTTGIAGESRRWELGSREQTWKWEWKCRQKQTDFQN